MMGLRLRPLSPFLGLILMLGIVATIWYVYRSNVIHAEILRADPNNLGTIDLDRAAASMGRTVFSKHCAICHGAEGKGDRNLGVPDLTYGHPLIGEGYVDEIERIVRYGVRSNDKRGVDFASMPAFGTSKPYTRYALPSLSPTEIAELTQHVLSFTGRATDPAAAKLGEYLFGHKGECYDCHQPNGTGDPAIGAPNLTDNVWLYGDGSYRSIYRSIALGRAGYSPAFARVLTPFETRVVAIYVASLRSNDNR